LLVSAIGFSPSDSISVTVAAGRSTTIVVPLTDFNDAMPIPLDTVWVLSCVARASEGSALAAPDSLVVLALCVGLGLAPPDSRFCLEWNQPEVRLLRRFAWRGPTLVPATDCTVHSEMTDSEWRWRLEHPAGGDGVFLSAGVFEGTGTTATIAVGFVSAPLGGHGVSCEVRRTSKGWVPSRWCYRTWIS
jgi:hypothetical protein